MPIEETVVSSCRLDHSDGRRHLYTLFNRSPRFTAVQAGILRADTVSDISSLLGSGEMMVYMLEGSGYISYGAAQKELRKNARVELPKDAAYTFLLHGSSSLLYCAAESFESAQPDKGVTNTTVFRNDFTAKQAKILYITSDCFLGSAGNGHYHDYAELYITLRGRAQFLFEDITTKEQTMHNATETGRVIVPKNTPHMAKAQRSTVLIGFTEQVFESPEKNEKHYALEWR